MKYLLSLLALTLWVGCSSNKTATVTEAEIYQTPISTYMTTDLNVIGGKKTREASGNSSKLSEIKNDLALELIKEFKADVLVEPHYYVETKGSKVKVILTAYPAKYHNFRNATVDDFKLINQNGIVSKDKKPQQDDQQQKASIRQSGWASLISIGAGLLLLIAISG